MNLIEQIESACREHAVTQESYPRVVGAINVQRSVWWRRIKAALEAAQEIANYLALNDDPEEAEWKDALDALRKFREAMNGEWQ